MLLAAGLQSGCNDFHLWGPKGAPTDATVIGDPLDDGRIKLVGLDGGLSDATIASPTDAGAAKPDGKMAADGGAPKADSKAPPPPADGGVPKPDSKPPPPPPADAGAPKLDSKPPTSSCGNAFETEVLALVNGERGKVSLAPLACHSAVGAVARAYSKYMCDARFFSHTGLDGSTPFTRIKAAGITYKAAGENIAAGQKTPAAVMTSWMNSSGHKANILGNYTHLGIGYVACPGGKYPHYWTQNFLRNPN